VGLRSPTPSCGRHLALQDTHIHTHAHTHTTVIITLWEFDLSQMATALSFYDSHFLSFLTKLAFLTPKKKLGSSNTLSVLDTFQNTSLAL